MLKKYTILLLTLCGLSLSTVSSQNISASETDTLKLNKLQVIKEIVVKPKRQKYSRKNNPAVELIRETIRHKNDNKIENRGNYSVEVYEKLTLSMDEFSPNSKNNLLLKIFPSLKNNIDTSYFSNQPILNASLREKLYRTAHCKDQQTPKYQLIARNHSGIDSPYDENGTLTFNLEELFRSVNIFDDDIPILLNRFVSPLSTPLAILYYEYHIRDTVVVDDKKYVTVSFVPASRTNYGFVGYLQISLDGHFSVARATMTISKNINLNWAEKINIEQIFQPSDDGTQLMESEEIYATFRPMKGAMPMQAHLTQTFRDYRFDNCDLPATDTLGTAIADWNNLRHIPLTDKEIRLDTMMSELRASAAYRFMNKSLQILISGYIPTRYEKSKSLFDFGPWGSTFSSNFVEGSRFRLGGMTTAKLHPHLFLNGYGAYGQKDGRWKYQVQAVYSFKPRKVHSQERPIHNITAAYRYDLATPGSSSTFADGDNVFNLLKSGIQETRMQYVRTAQLRYEQEFRNNFSFSLWLKNERNRAAGDLHYLQYQADRSLTEIAGYTNSSVGLQLRYAPGEKPYSGRAGRNSAFNMAKDAPVFTLSHQKSIKNLFGGDYNCNFTEFRAEKRFWLSSFGHIDFIGKLGKIWDKAPFPLLYSPSTNQSFFIQSETFTMMRAMEFIADEYAAVHATYFLKGWILNRIPLINKLKLREVASFGAVYGQISDKNDPTFGNLNGLFQLPADTRFFGREPYMEASVGLDNILRIIRLDWFYRINYRDSPNIRKNGLRMAFRFSF